MKYYGKILSYFFKSNFTYVIFLIAEECVQMISRGEFIESQTKQTIELEINGQVSRSLVVFGSLEDDGSCSYGGNWADQKTGDV